jgi:hypothetical protein
MGSFLSRLPSGGLRFSKRRVVGLREEGVLSANKVQLDKAHAATRGIGDARNITLEEVPISISWV